MSPRRPRAEIKIGDLVIKSGDFEARAAVGYNYVGLARDGADDRMGAASATLLKDGVGLVLAKAVTTMDECGMEMKESFVELLVLVNGAVGWFGEASVEKVE